MIETSSAHGVVTQCVQRIREEEGQVQNISPNMWKMGKMHSLVNDEANADFTLKSCGLLCLRGPPV